MQFNTDSSMHDIDQCVELGKILMNSIPQSQRSDKRIVRILIGEGGLDQHADNPHERTRIERQALSDIAQQMTGFIGSLLDREIFELEPITKAA